jgi:CheY-like chemotaxis protein
MMRARRDGRVLLLGEGSAEVEALQRQLDVEFATVEVAWDEATMAAAFDALGPDVLVLAFGSILKASEAYLALQLASPVAQAGRHRTVLLCHRDERDEAFSLCERAIVDDYVLFWPHVVDGHRLVMAILRCLRERGQDDGRRAAAGLIAHARDVAGSMPAVEEASRRVHALAGDEGPIAVASGELQVAVARQGMAVEALAGQAVTAPGHVLLVDGEQARCEALERLLAGLGHAVEAVHDGVAALAAAQRRPPALVLAHVALPRLGGIEMLRRLKAEPGLSAIPVILMSEASAEADMEAGVLSGASDFLLLPASPAALRRKLARALGTPPPG